MTNRLRYPNILVFNTPPPPSRQSPPVRNIRFSQQAAKHGTYAGGYYIIDQTQHKADWDKDWDNEQYTQKLEELLVETELLVGRNEAEGKTTSTKDLEELWGTSFFTEKWEREHPAPQ